MKLSTRALGVHFLTATGAVFAMLALLAAAQGAWGTIYLWLVVAFVVDGIDGPLARKYDVQQNAPQFDGVLLDLIIDYLTYVFIPAFALFWSGLLPGWMAWAAIGIITFASALYFSYTAMKTEDKSFLGFPGCWNMAVLVIFVLAPPAWVILGLSLILSVAMFLPWKFIHPVRTARWRAVSLPVALIWTALAAWAAWAEFILPAWADWTLLGTSVYLTLAGIAQQLLPRRG